MNRLKVRSKCRTAALAVTAILVGSMGGCTGHGQYTSEHIAQATEKISQLKSGTEWQMAQQQFLAGDLDKALKTCDKSIALNPRVAKSHVLRGRILIEKGRLEPARDALLEAEKLAPDNVEAQYYLGVVYERFTESEQALERYQKAATLDVTNPQYLLAAAEMLVELKRLDEAETMLAERRASFEYNAAIHQTLGHIAMLREQPAKGAQYFEEAVLLAPDDPVILEDLIRAQVTCGNFAGAEFNLARLMDNEEQKDRRDLKLLRVRCLVELQRPLDARTLLLEIVSTREGEADVRSWVELGRVANTLKDVTNLRASSTKLLSIAPDRFEGYFLRALQFRLEGKPEEALTALDKAAARSETDATPLVMRSLILHDLGRTADAATAVRKALERDPSNAQARALSEGFGTATFATHPAAGG